MKAILFLLAFCLTLKGQNTDPLVYTVGKTYPSQNSKATYDYLLWQPGDAATTFGKTFAVYRKEGDAEAASPFQRISVQKVQTAPAPILAMLKLGSHFDADFKDLPERITVLHAEAMAKPLAPDAEIPETITPAVAQNLAQLIGVASTNPEVLQSLLSLGRVHPGVMMSIGHAFSIEVSGDGVSTYEVRQLTPAGNDLRVIGRITLDQKTPHKLSAPGRPHPNSHPVDPKLQLVASAKDHLNVRLRWSMSEELRTQIPHSYGFNLYRIPKKILSVDPADITSAAEALEQGARKVNFLPIIAEAIMTEIEASKPEIQPEVFFYADDKNPPVDRFENGESFYYYVAARDIAGHPGPLSPPTQVTMCDRIPPSAPSISSVDNVFDIEAADAGTQTGTQHLRVVIRQVPEAPIENRAYFYRIYRWEAASDWQRLGQNPTANLVGTIPHEVGKTFTSFDDINPATSPPVASDETDEIMGKTIWYTVRSIDAAACVPRNLSGHSSAVYGVLRDRVGPPNPTGGVERCYCIGRLVSGENFDTPDFASYGLDPNFTGFVVTVDRRKQEDKQTISKKVKGFQVQAGSFTNFPAGGNYFKPFFNRLYHYEGFQGFAHIPVPRTPSKSLILRARIFSNDQNFSPWVSLTLKDASENNLLSVYEFLASAEEICEPAKDVPGALPPSHETPNPDGRKNPICGTVQTNDQTREVRVYRRVGRNGSFQMIQKSAGDDVPLTYNWKDTAPVSVNGTEICYFAQLFDEHGNGSSLVRIGCLTIKNDDLGTPLLSDPEPLPSSGGLALVRISWFCDPVGVDRFELVAAAPDRPEIILTSPHLSDPLDKEASATLPISDDESLTFTTFQTSTLESGFGNGGEFSLIAAVPLDATVYLKVRAVGKMTPDSSPSSFSRAEGLFSNTVTTNYVEPLTGPQAVIPWPARPLPSVAQLNIPIANYEQREGPFYAHSLDIEAMEHFQASTLILCGVFPATNDFDKDPSEAGFPGPATPLTWLFNYRVQSGQESSTHQNEPIFPFVVYRHQLPSDLYPNAVPNLVQVTPLIDRIGHVEDPDKKDNLLVRDPLFVFHPYSRRTPSSLPVPGAGVFSRDPATFQTFIPSDGSLQSVEYLNFGPNPAGKDIHPTGIWLRDPVPTTEGAKYQYLLVHFNPRGEIKQIIPTNSVQH